MTAFFPTLPIPEQAQLANNYDQISLMIIWAFVSGFSEKLVPHMLKKTAEKV